MDWITFYIKTDADPVWLDRIPWNWIELTPGELYLMAERPQDPVAPATILQAPEVQAVNGYQIGGWYLSNGNPYGAIDVAAYEQYVQPLGNNPDIPIYDEDGNIVDIIPEGLATKNLRGVNFVGSEQVMLGDPTRQGSVALYPISNQPFPGHMLRMYWPDITHPAKHGWQFELDKSYDSMDTNDPDYRDPSGLFIAVFADADCTVFRYVVGAFVRGISHFQVDDDGNPVEVWLQNNKGTQNTEDPEEINFAICNGHVTIHEGRATLALGEEKEEDLFWKTNQPLRNNNQAARSIVTSTGHKATDKDEITPQDKQAIKVEERRKRQLCG